MTDEHLVLRDLATLLRRAVDRSADSKELAAHARHARLRPHLSRARASVLSVVRLRPGVRVLQIGAGTGAVTRALSERGMHVTALEPDPERVRLTALRCEGMPVEVVAGGVADLQERRPFDLVLALDEPTSALRDDPPMAALVSLLAPGGALLLAVGNLLGLPRLFDAAGDGLEGKSGAVRRRLSQHLDEVGLPDQRWFHAFPDHHYPARILTATAYEQPDAPEFVDQITGTRLQPQAAGDGIRCNLRTAHRALLSAGLGPDVANGFVVLAARPAADLDPWSDPALLARLEAHRPPEWDVGKTVVLDGAVRRVRVDRVGAPRRGRQSWLAQSLEVERDYVPGPTLDRLAFDACLAGDAAALQEVLARWSTLLARVTGPPGEENATVYPFSPQDPHDALPPAFLDVNLDNVVLRGDGELQLIDTEWEVEAGVDRALVQVRALWRLARELVERGGRHPWSPLATPDELVTSLGALIDLQITDELLERWRRAESALQALVHGDSADDWYDTYRTVGSRGREQLATPRGLPVTALRRTIRQLGDELRRVELRRAEDLTAAERRAREAMERENALLRSVQESHARRVELEAGTRTLQQERHDLQRALTDLQAREEELARAHAQLRGQHKRLAGRRSVRLALKVVDSPLAKKLKRLRHGRRRQRPDEQRVERAPTPLATDRIDEEGLQQLERGIDVAVVVPIYNAPEELERCLEALVRNTTRPAVLLLIDDASTDPRVADVLARYGGRAGVRVLRNETNLGFTRTVNRGLREGRADVVILNSDTQVPPRWLEHLTTAAYAQRRIATVTALSDNAGAFSVPMTNERNVLPATLSRDDVGRLVATTAQGLRPAVPTGNGFCMYIRREALDALGLLDEERFPRGYGEENDFCLRALKAGWSNVVDDRTFVLHARGASFGSEKQDLIRAGRAQLDHLHPDYGERVRAFLADPSMAAIRATVADAFDQAKAGRWDPRTRILFVLHKGGGGTPATNLDLMRGLADRYACHVLISDTRTLSLSRLEGDRLVEMNHWPLARRWRITDVTLPDYRAVVVQVLREHAIELVHVRHLLGHTLDLPTVAHALGVPVVMSFHDFYLSCPTLHLLDDQDRYCGGVCTPGQGSCRIPTKRLDETPHLKHAWVHTWRQHVAATLRSVDHFVTTSEHTRSTHQRSFPQLEHAPFDVIEHGRDLPRGLRLGKPPVPGGRIRILIPGNLGVHKGSRLIRALKALDASDRLDLHFLGETTSELGDCGTSHGTYERDALLEAVGRIQPAFIGIFSIWPETYCHTLTEAWAAGVPVLASDIGALQERLNRHGGGWLVDYQHPERAYAQILAAADDPEDYALQLRRATLDGVRSSSQMADDYDRLYGDVVRRRRVFDRAVGGRAVIDLAMLSAGHE